MKVLVIGSGGREHCLVWKLAQSPLVDKIYCAPGNGGTALLAENVDIPVEALDRLCAFAQEKSIELTVVGPELPLARGIVDRFQQKGLKIFGPNQASARLEASKVFAKEAMKKYGIPTPDFVVFEDSVSAREYVKTHPLPLVIKADGLAGGKGVMVCSTINEALGAIDLIMEERIFGRAGDKVVIEECLEGEEVSILIFTDGVSIVPLVSSQDNKRALDGDAGPNTGGMGAYAPAVSKGLVTKILNRVCWPLIEGLQKDGQPYKGILYAGLMLVEGEPQVLEFNVRFGDPETQVILPKLKSDLVELMVKTIEGELSGLSLEWDEAFCLCVVLASGGYPGNYEKGKLITGLSDLEEREDLFIFHAGTRLEAKESQPVEEEETPEEAYAKSLAGKDKMNVITTGGRVLNVVGLGRTPTEAQGKVYSAVMKIKFDHMQYRKDIGNKAQSAGGN